ncbi:MAG: hypothetical protein DSM106950_43055 [Stigonema ocellatum SAG 48.90 = DSM 106950]|nr:hypothetical protein [Stigonema ocellatum SAG 48.90 = DSM 106950]
MRCAYPGSPPNFDLSSYNFDIGAGAIFNGGLTSNVIDNAFNAAGSGVSTPVGYLINVQGNNTGLLPASVYNTYSQSGIAAVEAAGVTFTPVF